MVSNDEVDLRDGLDFEGADAPVYDPQLQIWSSWRGTNLLKSLILMSDGSVCFFFRFISMEIPGVFFNVF